MKSLTTGGNTALGASTVTVEINWSPIQISGCDVDASAFLLNSSGKVRNDEDFIFYNQPSGANGSLCLVVSGGKHIFTVNTNSLPNDIEKISFAITIHGNANFAGANQVNISVSQTATFSPSTNDRSETALILGELYKRNGQWKFRAMGQGFTGGLGPLATNFGVDILAEEKETVPDQDASKIRLEKKLILLEKKAPQLIPLAKKARVALEKKRIQDHVAAVALIMDVSGSMDSMFQDGTVQNVVERILGLGLNFDDNGAIDMFAFQSRAYSLGELQAEDVKDADTWILNKVSMGGTQYAPVINKVLEHYKYDTSSGGLDSGSSVTATLPAEQPVYAFFVTDGDCFDKSKAQKAIQNASKYPIFFQFVGIGNSSFNFLEKLDDMEGRFVDNANFFSASSIKNMSDELLYEKMMNEYPQWLVEVKRKGLLR